MIKALVEDVASVIMDAGADQLCAGGANSRNGYRERSLATCVGGIMLRIPKLRNGSFFPEDVVELHQCVDRAAVAASASRLAIILDTADGLSLPNSSSAAALSILRVDSPSL